MKNYLKACSLLFSFISIPWLAGAQESTRLMHSPAVSQDHIAFIYAEDLWIANLNGTNPRRLTIDEGVESNPVFSPDGNTIAFSAEYDGNVDVFTVPATGGVPKRLTWHPYGDFVRDFSSDGSEVLFASQRTSFTNRYLQLFSVSVNGGQVKQLPIPYANYASVSGTGEQIAYTTLPDRFLQWKNYRGGTQSRIWIYQTSDHQVQEIPKPESGSNDTQPQWINNGVYFRSDRDGEFNLYLYEPEGDKVEKLTNYEDHPVLGLSVNQGVVAYEQAGYLYRYHPESQESTRININIATDLLEMRPRFVSGANYLRSIHISPSGARAVMDFRGEIVTVPAKKGDAVNLTQTPGVHEKFPSWSPDGNHIAYFSDESGEYALHLWNRENNNVRRISLNGAGFYAYLHWSPDSKNLCFVDNGRNLYHLNLATSNIDKIASDIYYFPGVFRDLFGSWSPDSRHIAYSIITESNFEQVFIYSLDTKASNALTDGLSNVSEPIFDPSGKYIFLLASTDAGPVVNWFDQSNQDMEMTNSIYLVTLKKETRSPLFKQSDQEGEEKEDQEEDEDGDEEKNDTPPIPIVTIDWEGIENRIVDLPLPPGLYRSLQMAKEDDVLYYLKQPAHSNDPAKLHKYDLKEREDKKLLDANSYLLAQNGKKMLYLKEDKWFISKIGESSKDPPLKIDKIQVKIDPVQEWQNIFNEAWRVNRDYFYDPGMHGADWEAMKAKYEVFLPHVTTSSDLYRVMQGMFSELAVGHHRFGNQGDRLHDPQEIAGGLLGADYEINQGRYRIKKIYGGLNWNPELRSPLTEPGVNINEGDYILAVNGQEVTSDDNLFQFFENTADKITKITVSASPNLSGSREVEVVPVKNEYALRNRDWVEGNIKKVHEATDGQVAYVYVPNTAGLGHQYFKRYFFPQANKKAVIIDERFNGGGQLADYYIDILKKPYQAHWNFRYGKDLKTPSASIQGPKVMLINETAGSGGDYLPWMFRKFEMGTIIGKRTWGGLVGVLGFPEFIDGGSVTAPNIAFWTSDGFRVENEGIPPDIEVEQWPAEVIAGKDPQLEKAIEVVMQQLEEYGDPTQERPDYPVRVRTQN